MIRIEAFCLVISLKMDIFAFKLYYKWLLVELRIQAEDLHRKEREHLR